MEGSPSAPQYEDQSLQIVCMLDAERWMRVETSERTVTFKCTTSEQRDAWVGGLTRLLEERRL